MSRHRRITASAFQVESMEAAFQDGSVERVMRASFWSHCREPARPAEVTDLAAWRERARSR